MRHALFLLYFLLTAMLITACSDRTHPDSQEPSLTLEEAVSITRTEATVVATIDRRGGPDLSYVEFHYRDNSESGSISQTLEGDPKLSSFTFSLTDLRPGTSYSCHMEAGTATASLKSNTITFTTIPNEKPKISGLSTISTGPLGIIVRFSINDYGGDPILEAGCDVIQDGSSESRRIYATDLNPIPEFIQLNIKDLTPATKYTITPFAANILGETRGETLHYTTRESVLLTEPGMLYPLFNGAEDFGMELLTIAGPMNGDDFHTLRAILGAPEESDVRLRASSIDLSDVSIVKGGSAFDGQRFTETDRLTTGILADCSLLRCAVLPNSATAVDRDAFARCSSLETLTLPASTETILPSSDCPKLKVVDVNPANTRYISLDGVLLSSNASQIIWFPCGKTGEYSIPATVTAIGENAFAETSITGLRIPSSVVTIGRGAFAGSSLREIRLPDSISNIAEGTFQNCMTLSTVWLGSGTEFIGDFAFDCTDLSDLYVAAEYPPYANSEAFSNRRKSLTEECTLHVPTGSLRLYRNHEKWGKFTNIKEFQP